ncbi:putative major intrinsic protein [Rosa chinensis]|uniref:Putative major intrinsic protein n=1 Tax=Rosa chinensis TaxID=74649 RepID=A0A2P6S0Y8_ROSCH|nr:putative major intrinsic protein [Rosa chinensis]
MNGGVTIPSVGNGQAFAREFIVTFNLMFVIIFVATDTAPCGLAIGATVLLDILIAGKTTGASMNPVRTLGPTVAAGHYKSLWIYLVAPRLGALAGAAAHTAAKLSEIRPNQQIHDASNDETTPQPRIHFPPDKSPYRTG